MFHPRELAPVCQREVSQSAAQLAANRIWRFLHDSPQPAQEQGDAFQFNVPFTESRVHANFFENQRPDQSLRRWLTAHLRASWPNRHLTIPGDLPLWIIEATHLLGLTGTGAITELHLPAAWLKLMRGSAFNEVLFDNFTLLEIDATDTHRHLLKVKRGCDALETACLLPDSERRGIELGTEAATASARLLYALELPAELYRLYDEQILVPLQLDSDESVHLDALELYGTCHLGQKLWSIASPLPLPPAGETLLFEGAGCGWLVPEATYLQDLKHLQTTDVDSQLAQLLSLSPDLKITQDATRRSVPAPKPLNRTLADELLHQLEVEGIPHFPDTYLYRLETGPLANFRFTPPLNLKQEMLGEYELVDAAGSVLKIVGEETKDSLLLAATLGRNRLELPEDRQQTAAILDSYRDDLRSLSQKIDALCLKHTDQPQAATRLHRKLWQQLNLPSLKWLSG